MTVYVTSSNSWRSRSGSSDVISNLEEGEWVEMDYVTSYSHQGQGGLVHPRHGYPLRCSAETFEIVLQQPYGVVDIVVDNCQIEQVSVRLAE